MPDTTTGVARFVVVPGCWGTRIDFRFPQAFEDKKDGALVLQV